MENKGKLHDASMGTAMVGKKKHVLEQSNVV